MKTFPTTRISALVVAALLVLTGCASASESANEAPPTAVPPTAVPPTAVPPTAVPPTAVPPTAVPPTAVPPTAEATAAPEAEPTELPETAQPEEPADDATAEEAPATTAAETVSEGAAIFAAQCARCHGAEGAGTVSGPSISEVGQFLSADPSPLVTLVTNGGTRMPAFGTKLSPAEIDAVVEWVVETFQ